MLLAIFIILMLGVFGKLIGVAFKMTWGLLKVFGFLIILPAALIIAAVCGLFYIAIPVLIVIGVVSIIKSIVDKKKTAE